MRSTDGLRKFHRDGSPRQRDLPKIPARVEEGNPMNWPRQIARKYSRTLDAASKLLGKTNEMNTRFAVTEFVFEREDMERAACAALCREAGCICFSLCCAGDFGGDCEGSLEEAEYFHVIDHDPRCPDALASRIEARVSTQGEG